MQFIGLTCVTYIPLTHKKELIYNYLIQMYMSKHNLGPTWAYIAQLVNYSIFIGLTDFALQVHNLYSKVLWLQVQTLNIKK